MSIRLPNFNMLLKELFLLNFVSLGILQYFYEGAKESFLVYISWINLLVPGPVLLFFTAGDATGCGWLKIPSSLLWTSVTNYYKT